MRSHGPPSLEGLVSQTYGATYGLQMMNQKQEMMGPAHRKIRKSPVKGNQNCSVPQCHSVRYKCPHLSFHRFPKDKNLRREWELRLKIGQAVGNSASVCSLHFISSDFTRQGYAAMSPHLKSYAVPSQNLPLHSFNKTQPSKHLQQERTKRRVSLASAQAEECTPAIRRLNKTAIPDRNLPVYSGGIAKRTAQARKPQAVESRNAKPVAVRVEQGFSPQETDTLSPADEVITIQGDEMPWTRKPLVCPGSAFRCPAVTNQHICDYHAGEGARVHPSAQMMYIAGDLVSFVCAQAGDRTFVRCGVRSEATQSLRYSVRLVVLSSGAVEAASCECSAGRGAKATCKHVAVALFGLEDLARTGQLNVERVCTGRQREKSATSGAPLKVARKVRRRSWQDPEEEQTGSPRQAKVTEGEHDRIMNLILNFQATRVEPVMLSRSAGRKANVAAYVNDHSYSETQSSTASSQHSATT